MATLEMHSSDSSSSEDEEDMAKFKEAVFGTCLLKQEPKINKKNGDEVKQILPTKRNGKETREDDFSNIYGTTPGFRKHMSKKLSEALDSEIDSKSQCFQVGSTTIDIENGVKLFSNSSKFLLAEKTFEIKKKVPVKKRPQSSSEDSSSEDERLREASVTHDFVLEQSTLPYMTNQKPADLVINQSEDGLSSLKSKENGDVSNELNNIENKCVTKVKSVLTENTNGIDTFETHTNSCKKKKKKKHKKKKMEEPD